MIKLNLHDPYLKIIIELLRGENLTIDGQKYNENIYPLSLDDAIIAVSKRYLNPGAHYRSILVSQKCSMETKINNLVTLPLFDRFICERLMSLKLFDKQGKIFEKVFNKVDESLLYCKYQLKTKPIVVTRPDILDIYITPVENTPEIYISQLSKSIEGYSIEDFSPKDFIERILTLVTDFNGEYRLVGLSICRSYIEQLMKRILERVESLDNNDNEIKEKKGNARFQDLRKKVQKALNINKESLDKEHSDTVINYYLSKFLLGFSDENQHEGLITFSELLHKLKHDEINPKVSLSEAYLICNITFCICEFLINSYNSYMESYGQLAVNRSKDDNSMISN